MLTTFLSAGVSCGRSGTTDRQTHSYVVPGLRHDCVRKEQEREERRSRRGGAGAVKQEARSRERKRERERDRGVVVSRRCRCCRSCRHWLCTGSRNAGQRQRSPGAPRETARCPWHTCRLAVSWLCKRGGRGGHVVESLEITPPTADGGRRTADSGQWSRHPLAPGNRGLPVVGCMPPHTFPCDSGSP